MTAFAKRKVTKMESHIDIAPIMATNKIRL